MRIPIVDNFVVRGEDIDKLKQEINKLENINGMVNALGEHYSSKKKCKRDVSKYIDIVNNLEEPNSISIKPTQIGLDINKKIFIENYEKLLNEADENNIFVWMDMEDSSYKEDTIEVYKEKLEDFSNIGICLQANLRRTEDDIKTLMQKNGKVRLVKGAYKEPQRIAYTSKSKIDSNYKNLIDICKDLRTENQIAIGSHDKEMIEYATKKLDSPEIQMLMGIRENYQKELAKNNKVSQYIPYGKKWIPYFYRRIRENKSNLIIGLKNIKL